MNAEIKVIINKNTLMWLVSDKIGINMNKVNSKCNKIVIRNMNNNVKLEEDDFGTIEMIFDIDTNKVTKGSVSEEEED